jgi:hypothetical protein
LPANPDKPPQFTAGKDAWRTLRYALVSAADSDNHGPARQEMPMVDAVRRARLVRDLEQEFVPDYDAQNMPSADKRASYALEHIAFRVGRIEQNLARIAAVLEAVIAKR